MFSLDCSLKGSFSSSIVCCCSPGVWWDKYTFQRLYLMALDKRPVHVSFSLKCLLSCLLNLPPLTYYRQGNTSGKVVNMEKDHVHLQPLFSRKVNEWLTKINVLFVFVWDPVEWITPSTQTSLSPLSPTQVNYVTVVKSIWVVGRPWRPRRQ